MKRKLEQELSAWKERHSGRALLVNGARQVGKTYILQEFGKSHFQNMVYVNLETNLTAASYFDGNLSPNKKIRINTEKHG